MFGQGDTVICIANKRGIYNLTVSKVYEVISYDNNGTFSGVYVTDDKGVKRKYKEKYFQFKDNLTIKQILERSMF